MVKITFPDGSVRDYEQGVTGYQVAESLSPALARDVVSCEVNGETRELNRPIMACRGASGTLSGYSVRLRAGNRERFLL